jgi:hypothetical protein
MDLQLAGTVETRQGLAAAMLCIDRDRPDEMIKVAPPFETTV